MAQDRDRWRRLMMAAVDREISGEDRERLEKALQGDPDLRAEWRGFQRLKQVTDDMKMKKPPEEIWDRYWDDVYRRLERWIGWILASVGAVVLVVWGLWTWLGGVMADSSLPALVRWSILALAAGLAVLLVSVIRERLFLHRGESYKDVIR